jgi:peptidoglycan/LPS O-acetylase OafA/YrhL
MARALTKTDRFATLDGLRGVAAVCVMLHHAEPNSPISVHWGYLAVDLFFCLSGFILAFGYEDRLRAGMTLGQFVTRRVIRLYPMGLVAALIGIVLWGGNANMILLLPDFLSGGALYPANPPMWSLLGELLANVAFAAFLFRAPTRRLLIATAICGVLLAVAAILVGTIRQMGPEWWLFLPGLARTGFSFGTGVLLFRAWRAGGARRRTTHLAWLPLLALPALLILPGWDRPLFDLLAVLAVMPAIVWLGASWELPARGLGGRLGDLSYPLYCINMPLLACLDPATGVVQKAVICAGLVAAALALDRLVDRPGQRFLGRHFRPGPPAPARTPAESG